MDFIKNQYPSINAAENNNYSGELINYSGENSECPGKIGGKNNYFGQNNSPEPAARKNNNYFYSDRANPRAFNKAPKIIIFSGELTATEKMLYLILQDYAWRKLNPTQAELAAALGCSERNIRKLDSTLKEAGLITTIRTGRSNRYILTNLETYTQTQNQTAQAASQSPEQRLASDNTGAARPAGQSITASVMIPPTALIEQPPQSVGEGQVSEREGERQSNEVEPVKFFVPVRAEAEFQSDRNSSSSFELNPINKNNKNHVCNTSYDLSLWDMTKEKPVKAVGEESTGQGLALDGGGAVVPLVAGGETPVVVQGAKSPALFSKTMYAITPTKHKQKNGGSESDEKQRDFVKVYENLLEFGFSEAPAQHLLELAHRRHGDQATAYLQQWTERINRYSWVENPQGYMTSAVKQNWSVPNQRRLFSTSRSNQAEQAAQFGTRAGRAGQPKKKLSRAEFEEQKKTSGWLKAATACLSAVSVSTPATENDDYLASLHKLGLTEFEGQIVKLPSSV